MIVSALSMESIFLTAFDLYYSSIVHGSIIGTLL